MNIAIECKNVHFAYGEQKVLNGIDAKIPQGEISALFGPNGSGKTTLLKCLAGLYTINEGSIHILGKERKKLKNHSLSRLIAYVPQEHALSFPFSVKEMVMMGRTPHLGGVMGPKESDVEASDDAISEVGITELAYRPYTELSGGQRQLVLVARALAQDTPIIILDEPTSALDFKNQIIVWQNLIKLKNLGKSIIVCTHDPNHVIWFCNEVFVLDYGKIISNGKVEDVMTDITLKELYGDICMFENGTIQPNLI